MKVYTKLKWSNNYGFLLVSPLSVTSARYKKDNVGTFLKKTGVMVRVTDRFGEYREDS